MPRTIRGTKGNDDIWGADRDERLVGGAGEDEIYGGGGHDDAYGGTGGDVIYLWSGTGRALGGKGEDYLNGSHGFFTLAGGVGNDTVQGTGRLFGDERPGLPQRTIGDDHLITDMATEYGATHSTHTGGRGADTFEIGAFADGLASSVTITDFTSGQDELLVRLGYTQGDYHPPDGGPQLNSSAVWSMLDTNHDGTLGNDTPGDNNSGVTVDASGLTIRLHEDTVHIAGVDTLTASDWAF